MFPKRLTLAIAATASFAGALALAQPLPIAGSGRAGAPRPSVLRILSPADHDLYLRAYEAAGHGDWAGARALGNQGSNALARQLLEWRYARDQNSGASFAEIDAALKASPGFPGRSLLYARAEQAILPDADNATVTAWFGARTPSTSIGKIRLGDALIARGDTARGRTLVREGWAQGSFDPATELAIVTRDSAILTPADDRARLDALLWRGETSAARREVSRVDGASAALGAARIALTGGLGHAKPALAEAGGSSDPGLLFDWSRALRLDRQDAAARDMLLRVPAAPMVRDHATRWWAESNLQARNALAAGDPRSALALVTHAGFASGDQYAEQQFLGGFITLRFLKNPAASVLFFQRLDAGVSRPISKARAQYWQGRAYDALGDAANAATHYSLAAGYPETFYGQLALAHQNAAASLHLNDVSVEAAADSELDADPLMPAIKILADLGQESDLRLFVDADTTANASPRHVRRLMQDLSAWGYPAIAVRLAKNLSYAGMPVLAFTHPVITLPAYMGPGMAPPPALVLGLIRQETEFDAYAVSSAGAEGIMQVMPGTARTQAKAAGIAYRPEALLSDSAYNIQLGMSEFAGQTSRFGGSVILAIAAYNAGPGNARKWIAATGDPRLPGVDPIDWIEQIPFNETRNYVQRVLENAGAYRDRLAGRDTPLSILSDLYAPNMPPAQ